MGTRFLFHNNAYLRENGAQIIGIAQDGSIELDKTIFYAQSGGQPGDSGYLRDAMDRLIPITNTVHPGDKLRIAHLVGDGDWQVNVGDRVICEIDWERRLKLMRVHTALHLLSVVFPFAVTGGSISENRGRLDFDMPEVPTELENLQSKLNAMIGADHKVNEEWISEEELLANPEMVKTMKVKPPMGQGRVRLIRIGEGEGTIDLQPCGGTHVATTGEIGPVRLGKIQKKGKQNRRVYLHLD